MVTKQQLSAALEVVRMVTNLVRSEGRVPAGIVYAACCGVMSIEQFESMIGLIRRSGLVRQEGDELVWIGQTEVVR